MTKKLWLWTNYFTFLFQNTDRRTRKDDTCRNETNSELPAVPTGASVWKMLLTERPHCQSDWLTDRCVSVIKEALWDNN